MGIPLAIVWAGGIVLVMLGGLGVSMCLQQIEFYIVVGTLWNLIVATPGASLFMTIMIVGNIGVLTQYLEKEIRSTGALIACAYLIVWTVPFGCLGYNIFGYIGLLPLLGVLSVPVFRLCVGSMLLGMGHAGVFVRSFETFIEDFRAGIFLLWHGLRYKNWSEGTKVQFFNALGLIAFFVMAVTHQEVYLMASPETWEDVFRGLKWQDIPTRDGSWRDIPINQLIGEKGEIKISLQEATPDEVKRILFWRLGEAPEALGAAGYGVWHIALGFIGGVGTCLSLYLLFKGGPTPPPPPPTGPAGGDKGTNQGMEISTGDSMSTGVIEKEVKAPEKHPEVLKESVNLIVNVGKPVTEGVKGSPSVAALVKMAVEGSSDKKGRVDSIPVTSCTEQEIPPVETSVKKFPAFDDIGALGKSCTGFYTANEEAWLKKKEGVRLLLLEEQFAAWRKLYGASDAVSQEIQNNVEFFLEFAKFADRYPEEANKILGEGLTRRMDQLDAFVDNCYIEKIEYKFPIYTQVYLNKLKYEYNEHCAAREKAQKEAQSLLFLYKLECDQVEKYYKDITKKRFGAQTDEARLVNAVFLKAKENLCRYTICFRYLEQRFPRKV